MNAKSRATRKLCLALAGSFLSLVGPGFCREATAVTPPVAVSSDSLFVSLQTGQPLNAFTSATPPDIAITVDNKRDQAWQGWVRIKRFDLLEEGSVTDRVPVRVAARGHATVHYRPSLPFGVYRIDAALTQDSVDDTLSQRLFFAFAPARAARDLPDDWPLAIHIVSDGEPLPGFKWYRYFTLWSANNPARGQYDWARLDAVFSRVKAGGGRLLLASDGAPSWTVAPERVTGMSWEKNATASAPDDMDDLRTYLRVLIARYDDGSGTLGAWEVGNEPNTKERWAGTPDQLIEEAKIFREVSKTAKIRPLVVGIVASAGNQVSYVQSVVRAGILPYLDIVSAHFYEEQLSYERETPINNLPLHVEMLTGPMKGAGITLPIWNTEMGVEPAPREEGHLVPQDELNRRASVKPVDPQRPWLAEGGHWRAVSERRAAGSDVAGIVMLMGLGVEKSFGYYIEGWVMDGAPSLPWVAVTELGDQIKNVDYHHVVAVPTLSKGDQPGVKALAYRIGRPDQPGLTVVWSFLSDTKIGRSKAWQAWLTPQSVQLQSSATEVEVTDLYGRTQTCIPVQNGIVTILAGEEPVYVREIP